MVQKAWTHEVDFGLALPLDKLSQVVTLAMDDLLGLALELRVDVVSHARQNFLDLLLAQRWKTAKRGKLHVSVQANVR